MAYPQSQRYSPSWANRVRSCPNYSTDIAAAFQVVEAMRAKGWKLFRLDIDFALSVAAFSRPSALSLNPPRGPKVKADTPALAVCLAALAALDAQPSSSAVTPSQPSSVETP